MIRVTYRVLFRQQDTERAGNASLYQTIGTPTALEKKVALDQFFELIGEAACKKIRVAATDQHDGYGASVRENCPNAKLVWDRFHIMQTFGEAVNETRKNLHNWLSPKDPLVRISRGKYRFIFLKKESRRTEKEQQHINDIVKDNKDFAALEIIKEGMLSFLVNPTPTPLEKYLSKLAIG